MKLIEQENPELEGILPRIFQGSNLPAENIAGLIEVFSRDILVHVMKIVSMYWVVHMNISLEILHLAKETEEENSSHLHRL
jgi:hypothetical protein